jgi:hypothetical protein
MPVIPALKRPKQGDNEFQASLGYIVRLCLKKMPLRTTEVGAFKTEAKPDPFSTHMSPTTTIAAQLHYCSDFFTSSPASALSLLITFSIQVL